MKKFIIVLIVSFTIIFGYKDLNAQELKAQESNIHNMIINEKRIKLDNTSSKYYIEGNIPIVQDVQYTIVFSYEFIGGMALEDYTFICGFNLGSRFICDDGTSLSQNLEVIEEIQGIYYSTFNVSKKCNLFLDDLLVQQEVIDKSLYNEFMIYKGSIDDFVGFNSYCDENMEFIGANKEIPIYISSKDKTSESHIRSRLCAYDGVDGNITSNIKLVEDEYTGNERTPGLYNLVYSVLDSNNNLSTITLKVSVIDRIAPTLTGIQEVVYYMSEVGEISENTIKDMLVAKDETDDVANDIYVVNSNLSSYAANVEATYQITYGVRDSSGNSTTHNVNVIVKDDILPVISAKDITVYLSKDKFEYQDLIDTISYTDNSDKFAPNPLYVYDLDDLWNNYKVAGEYNFKITVKDAAYNLAEKFIVITVVDDISPNFYFGKDILNATTNEPFSVENLIVMIKKNISLLHDDYSNFEIISTNYFDNSTTAGSYDINYKYDVNGVATYEKVTINVTDSKEGSSQYYYLALVVVPISVGWFIFLKRKNKISL